MRASGSCLGPGSPGADDAKLCQLPNGPATQTARLQTAVAITQAAPTATETATEAPWPRRSDQHADTRAWLYAIRRWSPLIIELA